MRSWISEHAERIAAQAPEQLKSLVDISSPSGDIPGAEAAVAAARALLPPEVTAAGVRADLRRVLAEPGHRDAAGRIAAEIAAMPAAADVVTAVDAALDRGDPVG